MQQLLLRAAGPFHGGDPQAAWRCRQWRGFPFPPVRGAGEASSSLSSSSSPPSRASAIRAIMSSPKPAGDAPRVAVVGGGLAGCAAAAALASRGLGVDLYDMGRTVGGRASHRVSEPGGYHFDHGAQACASGVRAAAGKKRESPLPRLSPLRREPSTPPHSTPRLPLSIAVPEGQERPAGGVGGCRAHPALGGAARCPDDGRGIRVPGRRCLFV